MVPNAERTWVSRPNNMVFLSDNLKNAGAGLKTGGSSDLEELKVMINRHHAEGGVSVAKSCQGSDPGKSYTRRNR